MDYSYIEPMMKGIINRNLFFKLYGFDKKFILSMMVSSLDKYKRYSCRQGIGSRIKLLSNKSMFDLFSGEFERVLKHIT